MVKSLVKCVSCLLYINQPETCAPPCGESPLSEAILEIRLQGHCLPKILVPGSTKHLLNVSSDFSLTDALLVALTHTSGATHVVLVVNTLMAPPFEPPVMVNLCILSLKAMLLFASTSVKRIGHLQALLGHDSYLEIGPAFSKA